MLDVADIEAWRGPNCRRHTSAYIATGVDDDWTVFLNHDAYSHIEIRSRRFTDISKLDTSRSIFGVRVEAAGLFLGGIQHARLSSGGGSGRGAGGGKPECSDDGVTGSSCSIEEVNAARNAPLWQQRMPRTTGE